MPGFRRDIMTASAGNIDSTREDQADLERLAVELRQCGLQAELCTPPGKLPYLHVRNPEASVLSERVYAQADSFWYSWAERIAGCDDAGAAAAILSRVLGTTGNGE
jgi:hypothetical protein